MVHEAANTNIWKQLRRLTCEHVVQNNIASLFVWIHQESGLDVSKTWIPLLLFKIYLMIHPHANVSARTLNKYIMHDETGRTLLFVYQFVRLSEGCWKRGTHYNTSISLITLGNGESLLKAWISRRLLTWSRLSKWFFIHLMATYLEFFMHWAFSTSEKVPSPFFATSRYSAKEAI